MGNKPLVSVITPTFNRAGYLRTAVDSVLAQTYGNFEIIVIDDGSTDDTPELMQTYRGDSRIQYYQQRNQGQSVARNVGIERSTGEYICFLDSDNAWLPHKLERSIDALEADPEAGVVYADCITIDESGAEIIGHNMRRHTGAITAKLLRDNFVSMNTTMSRADLIKGAGAFDPEDGLAEDYGLWLRVSTQARFHYVPEYWTYYRIMDNQLSSEKITRLDANQHVLNRFLEQYASCLDPADIRRGWAAFHARKARHLSKAGYGLRAFRALAKAMASEPRALGPWRASVRVLLDRVHG